MKLMAARSACALRQDLWKPENGRRPGERCVLVHKVLASVATWTAASHRHTPVSLRGLKALQTELFQQTAGTKSSLGEDAAKYCQRRSSELRKIKLGLGINELSVVAFKQLHAWAGQVSRRAGREPRERRSHIFEPRKQEGAEG